MNWNQVAKASVAIMAVAACVSAHAESKGMVASVVTEKATLGKNDNIAVNLTITNTSSQPQMMLKWHTAFAEIEESLFVVTRDGLKVPYLGAHYKRGAPSASDYYLLKPGASHTVRVALSDMYDVSITGQYTIAYSAKSLQLFGPNEKTMGDIKSAPASVWIDGALPRGSVSNVFKQIDPPSASKPIDPPLASFKPIDPPSASLKPIDPPSASSKPIDPPLASFKPIDPPSPTAKPIDPPAPSAAGLAFNRCTTAQQADIRTAVTTAASYSTNALNYMGGTLGARYTKWFGASDATRAAHVKADFTAIKDAFDNKPITVDCGCKKTYYAYVYPNQPYTIYVCKAFWTAPMSGTDSKGGTLVHEMSHFTATAGTDDWVYGQTGAASLAISDPAQATDNADSHEYFGENTPALN